MSQELQEERLERAWVMWKSLAFVYGVPIGITLGAIGGAALEIAGESHSAAWGLLVGVVTALVAGSLVGAREERKKFGWIRIELPLVSDAEWAAVVKALNVTSADMHFLMIRKEDDYIAYSPTLARPVAAGPLTVSGEYLSVVVTRLTETITITGPKYMVRRCADAATKARESAGLRE